MADWLPPQAQRIGGISCVGLALDGTSYLTSHSFQQIGEQNPPRSMTSAIRPGSGTSRRCRAPTSGWRAWR
jgi:hypothetical protein